jgi:hypothetical protein
MQYGGGEWGLEYFLIWEQSGMMCKYEEKLEAGFSEERLLTIFVT